MEFFTEPRMAASIFKAVVGSKVKGMTKNLEGAVGLDDEGECSVGEREI